MMGIVLPETCWACNKICNKYYLLHLVGILFPHNNDDAGSKSLQIQMNCGLQNILGSNFILEHIIYKPRKRKKRKNSTAPSGPAYSSWSPDHERSVHNKATDQPAEIRREQIAVQLRQLLRHSCETGLHIPLDKVSTFTGHSYCLFQIILIFYRISKEIQFTPSAFLTLCGLHLGAETRSNFLRFMYDLPYILESNPH